MSDELIRLTATEAVSRLRGREISPLELIDAAAARIAAVEPAVNALPTLCLDRARDHAKRLMNGQRHDAESEPGWLAGTASCDQGPDRCRGRAHNVWLADLPRSRAGEIASGGGTHRAQGRDRHRQVEHAGVRRRWQHVQRGVRPHAQSVEHVADLRRLHRWRRRRTGNRRGLARARFRPRRIAAAACDVLFGGGHPALTRTRHARHVQQSVFAAVGAGTDGAQRSRPCAVPRHDGGAVPARSADLRCAGAVVRRIARRGEATAPHRLHRGLRRPDHDRQRNAGDLRTRGAALRGTWLRGGGIRPRPRRDRRGVHGAAVAALRGGSRTADADASRADQAGHHLEHGEGPRADAKPHRLGGTRACRVLPPVCRDVRRPTTSSSHPAPPPLHST